MNDHISAARAIEIFREHGGGLRTREALRLGIHPRVLYALRDSGALEQLSRGFYRLAELPPLTNPDLVTVSLRVPRAVICLISALAFHELTTQVRHAVDIALNKGDEPPRLDYPPLRLFWFSGPAYGEGVDTHVIDGTPVRIYSSEKTITDCFKLRRRLGSTSPWRRSRPVASARASTRTGCSTTRASGVSRA